MTAGPTTAATGAGARPGAAASPDWIRRTLVALLASALSPLPLGTLFSDRGWLVDVWLSMLIVRAPALLLRLRRRPAAWQVLPGLVLLAAWLDARFLGQAAWHGLLPTRASWPELSALVTSVQQTADNAVAPVHSTPAIRLALCAVLGLLAAVVDVLAVAGRFGALAGVPLLVVYSAAGAVPHRPVPWVLFLAPAVGFLLLLALDAGEERARWGHRVSRRGQPGGPGRARVALGVSGQRIAVLALLAAVVVPLATPSGGTNLVSLVVGHHGGGASGRIDPFAALKGQLSRSDPVDLARVQIFSAGPVSPLYLREIVLPVFTGDGWRPADASTPTQPVTTSSFPSALPEGTGAAQTFTARISNIGLTANPPVFARPTALRGLDGALWSSQDQLVVGTEMRAGQDFVEAVRQPMPTVAELDRAGSSAATPATEARLAALLALPKIPKSVRDLVAALVSGKRSAYARAKAINDFFLDPASGFTYSLQTATGDSDSDLVAFLTNRTGYCQQYAAAMAVMLRLAGVPSRVVLGYAHAKPDADGTFTVTSADAHAWVEAYFRGVGWVPFDPTPAAGLPGGHASTLPYARFQPVTGPSASAGSTGPAARPTNKPHEQASTAPATSGGAAAAAGGGAPGWLVPLAVVLALVVLAMVPALIRVRRRRVRIRAARRGDPDPLWAELADTAVDLGYVWSPTRTPRQVADGLAGPAGPAAASLATLAQAVETHRYGPPGTYRPDGDALDRQLRSVRAGLRAGLSRPARLRAAIWPASVRRRRRH